MNENAAGQSLTQVTGGYAAGVQPAAGRRP